jgi:hypothetical protein
MGNAPKSPIPVLVFRNCSAVVAKFRLSGVGVRLVNPSSAETFEQLDIT